MFEGFWTKTKRRNTTEQNRLIHFQPCTKSLFKMSIEVYPKFQRQHPSRRMVVVTMGAWARFGRFFSNRAARSNLQRNLNIKVSIKSLINLLFTAGTSSFLSATVSERCILLSPDFNKFFEKWSKTHRSTYGYSLRFCLRNGTNQSGQSNFWSPPGRYISTLTFYSKTLARILF